MKKLFLKPVFRKYGRKALIIYVGWCLLKGLAFLLIGWLLT